MFLTLVGGARLLAFPQSTHPPLQLVIQFQFGDTPQDVYGLSQSRNKHGIECGDGSHDFPFGRFLPDRSIQPI